MLTKNVDDMIAEAAEGRKVHLNAVDRILNNADPQFSTPAMNASRLVLAWNEKEGSDLYHCASGNVREFEGRGDECSTECALDDGELIFVLVTPFSRERTEKNVLVSFQTEEKDLQMIIKNELREEP